MCMSNLYVVEFDNGDKMTGSISQVYAAQVDFFRAYQRTF